MKLRPIHPGALRQIASAIDHLAAARDLLAAAQCPRATRRVRQALKSADGARRHSHRRLSRIT